MVNNHICTETCFNTRNAEKLSVKCFICDKTSNSKCFEIPQTTVKTLSGSNAIFLCNKCSERVSKLKQNIRRSTDTRPGTSMNANEPNNDQRIGLNNTNLEQEVKTLEKRIIELHAKIDQQSISRTTSDSKTITLLTQGLKDLQSKMDQLFSHNAQVFPKNVPTYAVNSNKKKGKSPIDPLNWSFSFNPSTLPNENVELYQLLHGFEQNTWTSLDYLRHKLNENTDLVMKIESLCKELTTQTIQHGLESPVTNAINMDNLQTIQDKCEDIEVNIRRLEATIKAISKNVIPPTSNNSDSERRDYNTLPKSIGHSRSVDTPESVSVYEERSREGNETRSSELKLQREIYVSKLPITTTCDEVKAYIARSRTIDANKLRIHRLTKKHQDISKLTFLSFKIETNDEIADQLLKREFWPSHVIVKPWMKKKTEEIPRLTTDQCSSHFLSRQGTCNPIT